MLFLNTIYTITTTPTTKTQLLPHNFSSKLASNHKHYLIELMCDSVFFIQ